MRMNFLLRSRLPAAGKRVRTTPTLPGASGWLWRFRDSTPELSIGWFTLSKTAFFFLNQNLAFSGVVGLSDNTFLFHAFHQ
jgi:hypothetical protein